MGVPALQSAFRITAYLSAVSSFTSKTLTRGEARNVFSSPLILSPLSASHKAGAKLAKNDWIEAHLIGLLNSLLNLRMTPHKGRVG